MTENVISIKGGKTHLADSTSPVPFPLCGSGSRNTATKYSATERAVDCKECSGILARRSERMAQEAQRPTVTTTEETTMTTPADAPAKVDEFGIIGKVAEVDLHGRGIRVHKLRAPGESLTTLCAREATATVPSTKLRVLCTECATVSDSLTQGHDSATMAAPAIDEETTMDGDTTSGYLRPSVAKVMDKNRTKGETMPPRKKTAPANTKRTAAEVTADIKAALTAMETADNEGKIQGLEEQVRKDLLELTANKRAPLSMLLTGALTDARDRLAKPAAALAPVTSTDWRAEMADAAEVEAAAVERIRETAKLGIEAAQKYEMIGNIILEGRLRLTYKGLPDLHAKSRAAKQLSIDLFDAAKKGIDDAEVDLLDFHKELRKGVTNRSGDVLVKWLRALDESSDRTVFEETFPMIAEAIHEGDDVNPSDAIRGFYKDNIGVELPTQTRAEKAVEDRKRKKELEAKKEAGEELAPEEEAELSDEKPEATPVEKFEAAVKKVSSGVKAAKVLEEVSEPLDDAKRKELRERLEQDIETLKALYTSLL